MAASEMGPIISIITITYNAAETLERTIASVEAQDYGGIEYIIVDGGSTDGTLHIVGFHVVGFQGVHGALNLQLQHFIQGIGHNGSYLLLAGGGRGRPGKNTTGISFFIITQRRQNAPSAPFGQKMGFRRLTPGALGVE